MYNNSFRVGPFEEHLISSDGRQVVIDDQVFSMPFVDNPQTNLMNTFSMRETYDVGNGLSVSGPLGYNEGEDNRQLLSLFQDDFYQIAVQYGIINPNTHSW